LLVKLPVTVAELYAAFLAGAGLANLTYPFWWPFFRNHPPGVRLAPAGALTPFGVLPVATFPGTFAAFAAGAAMILACLWLSRGARPPGPRLPPGRLRPRRAGPGGGRPPPAPGGGGGGAPAPPPPPRSGPAHPRAR